MTISKMTNTTKLTKKEADDIIQKMHDVAKANEHSMSKQAGDSQHPGDIRWSLLDAKKKSLFSGSFPLTAHTQGTGGRNIPGAVATANKAITYLNEL
ncbi:MAG: hypothetical protein ABI054_05310 [Planctomycetota bacterium]